VLAGREGAHAVSERRIGVEMPALTLTSEYSMEALSSLAKLPQVRERERLRSARADEIVTPQVFAQLQEGWCVIDDVISADIAAGARAGAEIFRHDGMMYRLQEEYAPGRQDEIMPIKEVWREEWGNVPEEWRALDEVCRLVQGLAGAIARHTQSSDLAWLCPPHYMQLACFAAQGDASSCPKARAQLVHVDALLLWSRSVLSGCPSQRSADFHVSVRTS
jgi:hypothetical protein